MRSLLSRKNSRNTQTQTQSQEHGPELTFGAAPDFGREQKVHNIVRHIEDVTRVLGQFKFPVILLSQKQAIIWQNQASQSLGINNAVDLVSKLQLAERVKNNLFLFKSNHANYLLSKESVLFNDTDPNSKFRATILMFQKLEGQLNLLKSFTYAKNVQITQEAHDYDFNTLLDDCLMKHNYLFQIADMTFVIDNQPEYHKLQVHNSFVPDILDNVMYTIYLLLKDQRGIKRVHVSYHLFEQRAHLIFKIHKLELSEADFINAHLYPDKEKMSAALALKNCELLLSKNRGRLSVSVSEAGDEFQGTVLELSFDTKAPFEVPAPKQF